MNARQGRAHGVGGGEDDDGGAAATKRRGACDSCGSFQRRVDEETGEEVCESCGEVLVQANRTAVESSNLDRREQHFDDVVLGSKVRHVQRKGMSAQIIIQEQTRKLKREERARAVSKYRKAVERKRRRKVAGLPPLERGLPRHPDEVLSGPGSLPSKVIVENQPLGARKLRPYHYDIAVAAAKQVAIVPTAVRVEEGAIANLRINTTDVPVDLTNYVGRSPFRTSKVGVFSATGQFLTRADVQDAYERVLRRLLNSAVISAHQFLGLDARTLHIESHSLLTRYLYRVFNDSDVSRLCMNLPTSEISYLSEKAKDKPRVKFIVTPRSIIAAILVWFACNRKGLGALFDDFAALYDAGHLGSPGTSTETLDLLPPGGRPGFVRAQSFSPAIVNKLQAYLGIKLPSVHVCVREHKIYLPPLYRLAVRLRLANIRTLWPILTGILLSMLNIPEESALRRGHFEASLLTHQGLCALIIFAFSTLGRSHWARLRKGWNPSHPVLGGHHDDLCTLNIDRLSHPRHAVRLHEQILHWRNTRFHCQGRTLLHELTPELDALRDITQEEAKVQSEASLRKSASQSHADDGSSDSNFGDDSSDAQSSRGADSDGHHRGQGPSGGDRLVEDESEFAAMAQSLAPKNAGALEDLRVDRYLSRLPYTEVFQDLDDHLFRTARMWRAIVRTLDAPRPSFRDNLAATPLRSVLDQFEERYHAEIQLLADVAQVMHFASTNRLALYLRRLAKSFDRFARNNTDISAGRDLLLLHLGAL
ncbi:Hypothetical Protein FCC1311_036152 [Hondaea fermentalgiana]|uniref:TFIIB-type domain-containing protein n=1 Tax=Hondaea fermentalgiana TaxID=2315210 RepID=A0A2R5GFI5_9STRA|nr:Hypothetical Protein FCC1311_036152 [Hondaea fermentalgiana]|eukprot:GBG27393.1 Hypothetical Protein FCC1311_036152 [Hondaea fermentalgiana]